jgi:hypothetical protein
MTDEIQQQISDKSQEAFGLYRQGRYDQALSIRICRVK